MCVLARWAGASVDACVYMRGGRVRVYMTVLRLHHYCFGWPQLVHKCCKLLVPLPPTQSETLRALPQELERYQKMTNHNAEPTSVSLSDF